MTKKIVLTGATGWLGQEYLFRQFQKVGESFLDNFILVAGSTRTIKLFGLFPTKVYSLEDVSSIQDIEGVIHLAFILRHRVKEFGVDNFLRKNEHITASIVELVKSGNPKWVVNVSSGAIFDRRTGKYETDQFANPYGYGKYQEELALTEVTTICNIPIVIGRLWGASGFKMPPNSAYALSDFVESALTKTEINIHSDFEVYRRYCDAGEFLDVLVSEAIAGNSHVLNSGGPLHEIGEIAEIISALVGNVTINRPRLTDKPVDDYFPRESMYEELALKNGLDLASMPMQIQRTVNGHRDFMNQLKHGLD